MKTAKNTICLWFEKDAESAARFYATTFPDSKVTAVHKAPSDFPGGKAGQVLTVEFTVFGIPCLGLNGGTAFKQSEAFSFQIATERWISSTVLRGLISQTNKQVEGRSGTNFARSTSPANGG